MVIGVIHQDVKYHSSEQLTSVRYIRVTLADPNSTQDPRQLEIPHLWFNTGRGCSPNGGTGRNTVNPMRACTVEPSNHTRVRTFQRDALGFRPGATCFGGKSHDQKSYVEGKRVLER